MRSYYLEKLGGVGLVLREHDEPTPGPTEIVVRVRAVSINRRDAAILTCAYPLPARPVVVAMSDGAGGW